MLQRTRPFILSILTNETVCLRAQPVGCDKNLSFAQVTLTDQVAFDHAVMASEHLVTVSTDRRSFTFDLPATSDVLVLRLA